MADVAPFASNGLNLLHEALRIQPIWEGGRVPGEHSGPHGVAVIGSHRPCLGAMRWCRARGLGSIADLPTGQGLHAL
jgi:hypothetical protein